MGNSLLAVKNINHKYIVVELLKEISNNYWEDNITYNDLFGKIVFATDIPGDNKDGIIGRG